MRFDVGCDFEEFKRYYKTLCDLHAYFKTVGLTGGKAGELGSEEEYWIKQDPSHLIVWRQDDAIIGHAIWHETNTEEHKKGDPRDEEDGKTLRRLLGAKKENIVELHELWLKKVHRGKGYGKEFFEFFEHFVTARSFDAIVYYTDNSAGIAICRRRGWKEDFLAQENWHVFSLFLGRE